MAEDIENTHSAYGITGASAARSSGQFHCPCCGSTSAQFLPFGVIPRPNAMCPTCGSLERHRALWLYLSARTNLFSEALSVLHFAPEEVLAKKLSSLRNLEYLTADLDPTKAMMEVDITNIPFGPRRFDVILCVHVLEHIPDDRKAMAELFRVLKPGGWAILQSPLDSSRETTFEDPTVTSSEDRERLFGQRDHVRVYGRDYKTRLEGAGFKVDVDDYVARLGPAAVSRNAIGGDLEVYVCTKPA
jgi:SAM-dependent methyltransferase